MGAVAHILHLLRDRKVRQLQTRSDVAGLLRLLIRHKDPKQVDAIVSALIEIGPSAVPQLVDNYSRWCTSLTGLSWPRVADPNSLLAASRLAEVLAAIGSEPALSALTPGNNVNTWNFGQEDALRQSGTVESQRLLEVWKDAREHFRQSQERQKGEREWRVRTVDRVAFLVGHLRQFRKTGSVKHQPEYDELRKIGEELSRRGNLELMRSVAHDMAPRVTAPANPYAIDNVADSLSDIDGYWNGIGGWQS